MRAVSFFTSLATILAAFAAHPAQAQVLSGPVTIVDGDTVDMTGTRIRLLGIDAPEASQTCTRQGQAWACGAEATATLSAIAGGASLTCTGQATDIYGRTLARCSTPVYDIGQEMVRRGMAVALDNAPSDYAQAAGIAQRMRAGLWSGEFQMPAQWRAANPTAAPQRVSFVDPPMRTAPERRYTNANGCAIKGNHSRYGDWIYHLPGQKYYQQTRPERLFCTESEARAAGFRRSKE